MKPKPKDHRSNDLSNNGNYLWIYYCPGEYYDYKDIYKDLKDRGLSKYDLYVISEYSMLINDGAVALYTGDYLDWEWCWTRKSNLIQRVYKKLAAVK